MVESQRITRLVLHHRTLLKIVSDVTGIEEITSRSRHEREYLFRDRIDKLRRNDVQRRIRSRIDRGITLRRLKRDPLVYLINQNPSRIVELAILIASRQCNRNQLAIEQHELLIDVRATDRGEAELGGDAGRYKTRLRSHEVIEVAPELRGIGQQGRRGNEVFPPTWLVRKEKERLILAIIKRLAALARLRQENGSANRD